MLHRKITHQQYHIRCSISRQILAKESMQKRPQIFLQNKSSESQTSGRIWRGQVNQPNIEKNIMKAVDI